MDVVAPAEQVSGVELLWAFQGRGPSGIARLLGLSIADVEPGHVRLTLRTRTDFANPHGGLHGGVTATLLDSAMACAVLSALPPGGRYTTVDLAVTFLRTVALDGTTLTADGEVVHVGRRVATAQGRVHDDAGRLIATATTTCQVLGGAA
ncbi:MAG TPA: PaaI family thioesterase [Acidimicrobiia bacterium]|nr:PaaI family thioesterase [Acidimicrobiia bacterium]